MSKSLESRVWASGLDSELKPVAAFLADIANDDGTAIFPSLSYICWAIGSHDCGVERPANYRTVQRRIDQLLTDKVLEVVGFVRGDNHFKATIDEARKAGRGATVEYRMYEERLPVRRAWKERYSAANSTDYGKGDNLTPITQKGDNDDTEGCQNEDGRVTTTTRKGDNAWGDTGVTQTKTVLDPSNDPSNNPRDPVVTPAREGAVVAANVAGAREPPPARPGDMGALSAEDGLTRFAHAVQQRFRGPVLEELAACGVEEKDGRVMIRPTTLRLERQLVSTNPLGKWLTACAMDAGYKGFVLVTA